MVITALEPYGKTRIKVYLNDECLFWMYTSDIRTLKWKVGQEVTSDEYENVLQSVVLNNAKKKALSLLSKMDYASGDMKSKLRRAEYPEPVIDAVVSYLTERRYLDDERYAQNYVMNRGERKGKGVLRLELQKKGIPDDVILSALETISGQEELEHAYELLRKKYDSWRREQLRLADGNEELSNGEMPDYQSIQKMKAAAFRKGYSGDVIARAWSRIQQEELSEM
ncbi:MAG: regulatory protein RecX [Clostridiales bacterium]|nr:regulatory protein RecX [Clostridiales bacterium]